MSSEFYCLIILIVIWCISSVLDNRRMDNLDKRIKELEELVKPCQEMVKEDINNDKSN